jgi:hypothetical protein
MNICLNCASRCKTKEPEKWQFKICKCSYCGNTGDCADAKDWGVSTTSSVEIGDEGSQNVNSLF